MIRQREYTKSLSLNIIFVYSFQCELYFFKVKGFIDLRVKPRGVAKNLGARIASFPCFTTQTERRSISCQSDW